MSDDRAQGFLEDIIAHPDDDAPRLIFADWMEERGDPRGAFIRMQVELARAPLDDPRRPEWEFRVHDLLEDHEEEWLGPVAAWVKGWQFHRGFVEAVEMEAAPFLDHSRDASWVTTVRSLRLLVYGPDFEEMRKYLRTLVQSRQVERLETLDLSSTTLGPKELKAVAASPCLGRLKGLDLGGTYVDEERIRSLVQSPLAARICQLSLSAIGGGTEALSALAGARLPALRSLNLTGFSADPPALHNLASASWLPQLQVLHLGGNALPESELIPFLSSPGLGHLAVLSIASHGLTRLGTPIIAALVRNEHLSGLSRLCLEGNAAEPRAVHDLVAAPTLPALTALRLNRLDLHPEGLRQLLEGLRIRGERGYPGLRALGLGHNRLGAGARALAECPALANLVALELHDNGIRDADVDVLAQSPHLGRLTTLDLANNAFGLRGVQAMAASSTLGNLSRVNLGFTAGIENAARWALSTSTKLPWLLDIQFATHYGHDVLDLFSDWWAFPTRVHFRRRPTGGR
jgi:uncharacterized protein (TIGR02996 family)